MARPKQSTPPPCLSVTGLALERIRGQGDSFSLRDVSLALGAGEFATIEGASGGGKSSLLLALAGLIPTNGGTIALEGKPQPAFAPEEWRARVAMAQAEPLMVEGTVADNLLLAWHFKAGRKRPRPTPDRLAKSLAALGLAGLDLESDAGRLSTGQRERVALLRHLVTEPTVLLCDEPTANLDPKTSALVWKTLQRFRRENGGTVLCVTHDQPPFQVTQRLRVAGGRLKPAK